MRKYMIHPSLYVYESMELTPYRAYVYALQRDGKVCVIDTLRGSTFMDIIKVGHPGKDFVVISTHYHFDHMWGNYNFSHCPTYAYQLCKTMIQHYGIRELQEQEKYFQGIQTLTLSNHCFNGKQLQMTDGLRLPYTPGHTPDRISVCDQTPNALFVGGTLEKPLTQIEGPSLSEYRQTLEYFLTLPVAYFYAGHTLQLIRVDVRGMLAYIHVPPDSEAMQFDSEETQRIYLMNLNVRKQ